MIGRNETTILARRNNREEKGVNFGGREIHRIKNNGQEE